MPLACRLTGMFSALVGLVCACEVGWGVEWLFSSTTEILDGSIRSDTLEFPAILRNWLFSLGSRPFRKWFN